MGIETLERREIRPYGAEIDSTSEVPVILNALNETGSLADALHLLDVEVGVVEGGTLWVITEMERDQLKCEANNNNCDISDLSRYKQFAHKGRKLLELHTVRSEIIEAAKLHKERPEEFPAPIQYGIASYFTGRLRQDAAPAVPRAPIASTTEFGDIMRGLFVQRAPKQAWQLLKDDIGIFKGGALRDVVEAKTDLLYAEAKRKECLIQQLEAWPIVSRQAGTLLELIEVAKQIHAATGQSEPHKRNLHYGLNRFYLSKLEATGKALPGSQAVAVPEGQETKAGGLARKEEVDQIDAFENVDLVLGRALRSVVQGIDNLAAKGAEALEWLIRRLMTPPAIGKLVLLSLTSGNVISVPPQQMRELAAAVVAEHGGVVEIANAVPGELAVAAPAGADVLPSPPSPEAPPKVLTPQEETMALARQVIDHPLIKIADNGNGRTIASVEHVLDDGHTFLYDFHHMNEAHIFIDPGVWKFALELADQGINVVVTSLTTSHEHSENSWHYKGLAIDLKFENAEQFQQAFKYLYDNRERLNVNELILGLQLPPETSNLKNGQPHVYGPGTLKGHMGHIHISVKAPVVEIAAAPVAPPENSVPQAGHTVEQFMAAIASQESKGDPNIKNGRTNAHGYFQILPSNWPKWCEEALGEVRERNPENQILVAKFKMEQYYQALGSWEAVAIAWFAGPAAAQDYVNGDTSVLNRSDGIWTVKKYVTNMQEHIGKIDPNVMLPILTDVLAKPAPAPAPPPAPAPVIRVAKPPKVIEEAAPPAKGRVQKLLDVLRVVPGIEGGQLLPAPDEAVNNHPGKGPKAGRK